MIGKFQLINSIVLLIIVSTYLNSTAQFQNIRINKLSSRDPQEVTIAINPANPQQLAAASNLNYFYFSEDGGITWNEKKLLSTLGVFGDPSIIYNGSGNLYYAHLSNPSTSYLIDRIVVQSSTDNGNSWSDGASIGYSFPKQQDKEWLAVDLSLQSPYKNSIYVAWTEFDSYGSLNASDSSRILFSRSLNDGISWRTPVKISDIGGDCLDSDNTVQGCVPAIGPDGAIYVSWMGRLGLVFDKSTNGGASFGKDEKLVDIPNGWDFRIPGLRRTNGFPVTATDISNSPYRGNIYIQWSDQRNGEDNTDVFFIKSTDKGTTWSDIKRVNNDDTERHQFFSWLTVDPVTGIIYSIFYDRRNTTGTFTDVYIARSDDGGETFRNYKINESSFQITTNVFFGDYISIAAYDGIVRPIWTRLDYLTLSIWTAIISDGDLISYTLADDRRIVKDFQLLQNYPNPFNPMTTISFLLPRESSIKIRVSDILGKTVGEKFFPNKSPGVHEFEFDGADLSSGIYFYSLITDSYLSTKKMILLK